MGYHLATECANHHGLVRDFGGPRPQIVVLCGSSRFMSTFDSWRRQFAIEGKIVLSIAIVTTQADDVDDLGPVDPVIKSRLDELYFRKIDLADEVFVLNVHGYVGASTQRDIEYATSIGKPIRYLEPLGVHNT